MPAQVVTPLETMESWEAETQLLARNRLVISLRLCRTAKLDLASARNSHRSVSQSTTAPIHESTRHERPPWCCYVMGTLMCGAGHVWAGHAHFYLHDHELARSPPDDSFIDMLKQNCCLSGPHFLPPGNRGSLTRLCHQLL